MLNTFVILAALSSTPAYADNVIDDMAVVVVSDMRDKYCGTAYTSHPNVISAGRRTLKALKKDEWVALYEYMARSVQQRVTIADLCK